MQFGWKVWLVVLAALFACASPAHAQSANAKVKAKVLKPITMTGNGTIDLGTIVLPTAASFSGSFTVDPAATQTTTFCAAGFTCMGTPAAALFNIQGTKNVDISISIPVTVTMTQIDYVGGGTAPTINLTTSNSLGPNDPTGLYTFQIPGGSGNAGLDFYIGGTATLDQTVADGNYEGTFTVTADYL